MESVFKFFKTYEVPLLGLSSSILISYLFLRNHLWSQKKQPKSNLLQITLAQLIKESRHANMKKVIITASPSSKGTFRRGLINRVKSQLSAAGVKVLINCSPQKLLKAGCECFIESMEPNDSEFIEYYLNALKAQYLIEDTISNIELINQYSNGTIVMICDNNAMDIKLMNESQSLWKQFLLKYNINEKQIIQSYDLVIHLIEKDSNARQDERIKFIWEQLPDYHQIVPEEGKSNVAYDVVLKIIYQYLERSKESALIYI